MHKRTFSHNGATITVRTEDGSAYIDRMTAEITLGLYETFEEDDPAQGHVKGERVLSPRVAFKRTQFAAVWAQSDVEGDLGFEWPQSPLDQEAMLSGCEAWLALPGRIVGQWINEVNMVNMAPNDPDLKPPEEVEKKD